MARRDHFILRQARSSAATIISAAIVLGTSSTAALAQNDVIDLGDVVIEFQDEQAVWQQPMMPSRLPSAEELAGVEVDSALRVLVEQLDDPSFTVREEATSKLVQANADRLQFYKLLEPGSGLSAEQRFRVLMALRETLMRTPRGAIGIRMNPVMRNIGGPIEVRVDVLLPGLPAEKVLKVGDRITHVDGEPLRAHDELTFRVQSKKPGDKVSLVVLRPAVDDQGRIDPNAQPETLHVELELAPAELLEEFNEPRLMPQQQQIVTPPTRIEALRLEEAKEAAAKRGPRPEPLQIAGETQLLAPVAQRALAEPNDADSHPWVQDLLSIRQLVAQGQIPPEDLRVLRDQWRMQYVEINRMLNNRNITQERQEFLLRVRERFGELMHEIE